MHSIVKLEMSYYKIKVYFTNAHKKNSTPPLMEFQCSTLTITPKMHSVVKLEMSYYKIKVYFTNSQEKNVTPT